jgi:hypothetical protein
VKRDGVSTEYYVAYPEGDQREIEHELRVNQLVDLNGAPLPLPLPTSRMIVYRVWKVSTRQERYTAEITYHLELVTRPELDSIRAGRG